MDAIRVVVDHSYSRAIPLRLNSLFAAWTRRWGSGPRTDAFPLIRATASLAGTVEPLPIPSVDYEAHYDVWDTPAHAPMRTLVRHSAGRYRMDRDIVGGLVRTAWFMRQGDKSATIILEAATARAAFHVAGLTGDPLFDSWQEKNGTRVGEGEMLGERCAMWKVGSDVLAARTPDVCLTDDGVLLYAALARTPTIPLTRALHLQRQRQDPGLLSVPPGSVPQEVPNLTALGEELVRTGLVRM